ncbi:dolichyl-diphosphooligosaccharide--protein glycosyltransferase subunit 1 [Anaeramoeba flamelloides]|uniref:Dolichyl-diphosphooligosaccharide--protein glycosyltransferase subunit 1 n=1 Tax=Anaeramoeba flamelloides TaxID=1746091 RepID=A0ABQ8YCX5_9EUKA|nr:dolichyl-diphosphooligosaccharide--protein glycosyltransferase subunit 1 [Anaeramoeba flamelloides]
MRVQQLVLIFIVVLAIQVSSDSSIDDVLVRQDLFDVKHQTSFVNEKVTKQIDLSALVPTQRIEIKTTYKKKGDPSSYFVTFQKETSDKIAFIKASMIDGSTLEIVRDDKQSINGYSVYSINFPKEESTKKFHFIVELDLINSQIPSPKTVTQKEDLFLVYADNIFFYTPYLTKTQKTEISFPSNFVKSHTKLTPTELKGNKLVCGPYKKINGFSHADLKVHFQNNQPLPRIKSLTKTLTVSHFGNLFVDEYYVISNEQAKLVGEFSRLDYSRNRQLSGRGSFQDVALHLHEKAYGFEYFDIIGNISTSQYTKTNDQTVINLKTRFPIFGEWKTDFHFTYNIPLKHALSKSKKTGLYRLTFPFGSSINAPIEDFEIKIILPEGTSKINAETPFGVDSQSFQVYNEFLDTTGRPVLVLEKKLLVPSHNQNIEIFYDLSFVDMWRKPILLVTIFFIVFCLIILISRINLSLYKSKRKQD